MPFPSVCFFEQNHNHKQANVKEVFIQAEWQHKSKKLGRNENPSLAYLCFYLSVPFEVYEEITAKRYFFSLRI